MNFFFTFESDCLKQEILPVPVCIGSIGDPASLKSVCGVFLAQWCVLLYNEDGEQQVVSFTLVLQT